MKRRPKSPGSEAKSSVAAADAAGAILQVKVWVRMLDGTNLEPSPDLLGQLRGDMAAEERGDLLCLHTQHRLSDQLLAERSRTNSFGGSPPMFGRWRASCAKAPSSAC
jgi:hypothetical protein